MIVDRFLTGRGSVSRCKHAGLDTEPRRNGAECGHLNPEIPTTVKHRSGGGFPWVGMPLYFGVVSPLDDIVEAAAAGFIRRLKQTGEEERQAALARTFGRLSTEEADVIRPRGTEVPPYIGFRLTVAITAIRRVAAFRAS